MKYLISFVLIFGIQQLWAAAGTGHSLGLGVITMSPSQSDLDSHIASYNANGGAAEKFGSAYEFFGYYTYRFSSSIFALQLRPSYFMSNASGGYSLSGFTFFPLLRLYPLENNFIKFFLQSGVGYGRLSGKISQTSASNANYSGDVSFSGDAFGALAGLGAEFCFTDNHCVSLEGNLRYLPIQRNTVSSSSGNINGAAVPATGDELEISNKDLQTTMSGIQGGVSYTLRF